MKVEIDTINKTIKVLDECAWQEVFSILVGLGDIDSYKFIPNTIVTTIKFKDSNSIPWVQPYTQPYTRPMTWCGNENTTISSTNYNQVKN